MKHVTFILHVTDLSGDGFDTFAERELIGQMDDFLFVGKVNLLVAKGKYEPTKPYFFIHEFKKISQSNW